LVVKSTAVIPPSSNPLYYQQSNCATCKFTTFPPPLHNFYTGLWHTGARVTDRATNDCPGQEEKAMQNLEV
jgi:hypothetical protein